MSTHPVLEAAPERLHVLRLCTAFMPPADLLMGKGSSFDPIGGMQNHTCELTRALDARGVRQTVVTTKPPGSPRYQRMGSEAKVIRLGLPVRHMRQLYSMSAGPTLASVAGCDLVHAHLGEDLALLPLAWATARAHRLPLILTIHCSLHYTLAPTDVRSWVLKRLGGAFERWTEKRADAGISLTPRLASMMVHDGVAPERVHVIPSGVRSSLFAQRGRSPWPTLSGRKIVFVGRLVPQKGAHVLVQAAQRLRADAKVIIVGDGPERASLEAAAREAGVADRVVFHGFVPHDDIPSVLAHADVLVLPSIYEELGSIIVEAMQVGLPVVASDTGGIPAAVAHGITGLLVPPGHPEALADGLDRVLLDEVLAQRLRLGAKAAASRYDWDVLSGRVLEIYKSVLHRTRGPYPSEVLAPANA